MADDLDTFIAEVQTDPSRELNDADYDRFKAAVQSRAVDQGHWAGVPIVVRDIPLTLEPRYPYQGLNGLMIHPDGSFGPDEQPTLRESLAKLLTESVQDFVGEVGPPEAMTDEERQDTHGQLKGYEHELQRLLAECLEAREQIVNTWYSWQRNAKVTVLRNKAGRSRVQLTAECPRAAAASQLGMQLKTMGVASEAWKLEVELTAMRKLKSLIPPHLFTAYVLTGAFIETSKRSGLTYMFRKTRPTVAMGVEPETQTMRVVSTLCLHPIGYYAGTWAGAMCPTDDVIAHLMLMRGDEYQFWKKANHHRPWEPEAGL